MRITVPLASILLTPQWSYLKEFWRLDDLYKSQQKQDYDREHGAKVLLELLDDTNVWISTDIDPMPGQALLILLDNTWSRLRQEK